MPFTLDRRPRSMCWPPLAVAMLVTLALFATARAEESAPTNPGKRYLIVHSDDAGMCHSVNRATIEALEKGIVSSCSIMMPCPWVTEFAAFAREHPQYDYGLHLTLNSEWDYYRWGPVAGKDKVPSLVDENGFLWDNVGQVVQHAKRDEVETELRAQIELARKMGIPVSHLDTHMGALVSRPDLVETYVQVGLDYDLPVMFLRRFDSPLMAAYPALRDRGPQLAGRLEERTMPLLDGLLQFYDGEGLELRRKTYLEALAGLPAGVSQLIIHCGVEDPELRAVTSSASRRDSDYRIFTDEQTAAFLKQHGIELISWKEFRRMAKK